jgi:arginase
MRTTAALALEAVENGDGPVVVHMDVDVIDPGEMPARPHPAPGPGLSFDEASDLVAALVASPRVVAFELCEYAPDDDPDLATGRRLVELLSRAVARRFRAGR